MPSTAQERKDQFYKVKLLEQHCLIPVPANRNQNRNHKAKQIEKNKTRKLYLSWEKKMLLKSFWIKGNIQREITAFLKKMINTVISSDSYI